MTAYLLRRVAQLPLVLFAISVVIFSLMHISPGDPISIMLGVYASPESIAALREEHHLDEPLIQQYGRWVLNAARGDLGRSIRTSEDIATMIADRFPVSLALAGMAMFIALLVAIPVGVISGFKHNSAFDFASMVVAIAGLSIPNFALALFLIYGFAVGLDWFPVTGIGTTRFRSDPIAAIHPFILPAVALGVAQAAILTRLLRSSMLEVLGQDYIRTASAKGLSNWSMLVRHALRNALMPVVTVIGINFAYLVGSTITIEYIFAIPGMGTALIQAVINRDFPVIQGFTLFIAVFFIATNLIVDVVYTFVDPRIRY